LGNYVSIIIVPSLGTHISKPGIYVSVNQVGISDVAFVLAFMLFMVTGCILYWARRQVGTSPVSMVVVS
jgi:hypothetical protein